MLGVPILLVGIRSEENEFHSVLSVYGTRAIHEWMTMTKETEIPYTNLSESLIQRYYDHERERCFRLSQIVLSVSIEATGVMHTDTYREKRPTIKNNVEREKKKNRAPDYSATFLQWIRWISVKKWIA